MMDKELEKTIDKAINAGLSEAQILKIIDKAFKEALAEHDKRKLDRLRKENRELRISQDSEQDEPNPMNDSIDIALGS
jgi:hypothetical protein